MIDVENGAK